MMAAAAVATRRLERGAGAAGRPVRLMAVVATPLSDAFVAALPSAVRAAAGGLVDLEARLAALAAAARASWPELPLDEITFAAEIAARAAGDLDDYLAHCSAGDLHLATACARGVPGAVAAFERHFARDLDALTYRFRHLGHDASDLRQVLFERLFTAAPGEAPRISNYAGQGHLQNWLRVAAVRTFLDLDKRKDRPREEAAKDGATGGLLAAVDVELELIKHQYRGAVVAALDEAAAALPRGDRHLLRQQLVGGLTIDQLAAVHGIHRATAARRIARAREMLLDATRAALRRRLKIDDDELAGLATLVASRLDVSLARVLATRA